MGRPRTNDHGGVTLETVIAVPVLLTAVLLTINAAVWYHARSIALASAQEGIRVARAHNSADDGSATALELMVFAPALIIMLLLVIAAGRITQAHQAVEAAARDAARQASLARDPVTARQHALTSARASLARQGLSCPARVTIDPSGLTRPVGRPATVTAHVTCRVGLADVAPAGVPPVTVTATYSSPVDPYRGRQP